LEITKPYSSFEDFVDFESELVVQLEDKFKEGFLGMIEDGPDCEHAWDGTNASEAKSLEG
jgi:hypothetical protein